MRQTWIRAGVVVLLLAVGASCSGDDDSAPASEARSEPPTTLAASTPVAPRGGFTACVNPGPSVENGTEEHIQVSLPDGEMTITRGRGATWRLSVSDVSDPRLDGTWYASLDGDQYTLPQGVPGPGVSTWTTRIENDEGAWQGSTVTVEFPDGESLRGPLVLTGEGAYEGLTAVAIELDEDVCPNSRGYIINGAVPPPRVPSTGR
jgi:hypothetical protein